MGTRYLIDTNAIIDFCNGKIPANGKDFLLNINPEISIITHIELFATKNITHEEYELLQKFVSFSASLENYFSILIYNRIHSCFGWIFHVY
ncbi:hypothetical protein VB264_18805 [Arcicella aquatica]|uniref:PIN domain-containing protein n=1 Tax=Arcicella aquatica TaxID=217141 RepID=A0ABU5QT29_9BACT|nr:hypothetical protein [Arcicella aquatica]MEA5259855.1 hypothetical protein [Arcicella aquatica]